MSRRSRRVSLLTKPGRLFLPDGLVDDLATEAGHHAPRETGGMLIGYCSTSAEKRVELVVTATIGAGPRARRRRLRFAPDGRWQQKQLESLYQRSGRVATYLGDWHSHPRGTPRPSLLDRRTYARVAAHPDAATSLPLMLILALGDVVSTGAYTVDRQRRASELEVLHYTS